MGYRVRIKYSAAQKAEIWDRWRRGESMSSIGRVFDRESSSVFSLLSLTGVIRPAPHNELAWHIDLPSTNSAVRYVRISFNLYVAREKHNEVQAIYRRTNYWGFKAA
jgi:hypothetical protein